MSELLEVKYKNENQGETTMIYITGDCHQDYHKFTLEAFPEQREMTREDYVIVCGDFGYWDNSPTQEWWMNWLGDKPFTLLWCDGNHENYDMLDELPVKEWKGGKVQFIRENVIHLMRGQIYNIDGCRIFTFGGAASHDINDGILELDDPEYEKKYKQYRNEGKMFRVNHKTWWEKEMPSQEEYDEGARNLEANQWNVDYIISHCGPSSAVALLSDGWYKPDELTKFFEKVRCSTIYKKWFFGHYHMDKAINDKEIVLYDQIVRIW